MASNHFPTPRWSRWNDDVNRLRPLVDSLLTRHHIWKRYQAELNALSVSEAASVWHSVVIDDHADATTMSIRRLVDRERMQKKNAVARNAKADDEQPVSLHALITDMARHANQVSEINFIQVWRPESREQEELAKETFRGLFGPNPVTQDALEAEARQLRLSVADLVTHGDKRIAHTDRANTSKLPRWHDVDRAVELCEAVFRRYHLLVTCGDFVFSRSSLPSGWELAIARACAASIV